MWQPTGSPTVFKLRICSLICLEATQNDSLVFQYGLSVPFIRMFGIHEDFTFEYVPIQITNNRQGVDGSTSAAAQRYRLDLVSMNVWIYIIRISVNHVDLRTSP